METKYDEKEDKRTARVKTLFVLVMMAFTYGIILAITQ